MNDRQLDYNDYDALVREVKELRRLLWWALGWVNAKARISHRAKYEAAVRMTKQPDPQAWRDR